MALIQCKACGVEISKKAKKCPQCGEPAKKKTSFMGWLLIILGGLAMFGWYLDESYVTSDSAQQKYSPASKINTNKEPKDQAAMDAVKKYLGSDKEESVFEAVWFNPKYLKVSRYDTGSNQRGFAIYICTVLNNYGLGGKRIDVEIIDVVKIAKDKKWVVLGKTTCK